MKKVILESTKIWSTEFHKLQSLVNVMELDAEDILSDFFTEHWDDFVRDYTNNRQYEEYKEELEA